MQQIGALFIREPQFAANIRIILQSESIRIRKSVFLTAYHRTCKIKLQEHTGYLQKQKLCKFIVPAFMIESYPETCDMTTQIRPETCNIITQIRP